MLYFLMDDPEMFLDDRTDEIIFWNREAAWPTAANAVVVELTLSETDFQIAASADFPLQQLQKRFPITERLPRLSTKAVPYCQVVLSETRLHDFSAALLPLISNYTYIIECADGTLYTGWTNRLAHRMRAHAEGKGCKYTKSHGFSRLVYTEQYSTKQKAMQREWEIKQMSRLQKQNLIKEWTNDEK